MLVQQTRMNWPRLSNNEEGIVFNKTFLHQFNKFCIRAQCHYTQPSTVFNLVKSSANDTGLLQSNHTHITTFCQSYESVPVLKPSFLAKVKCAHPCAQHQTQALSLYGSNRALGNIISGNLTVKKNIPEFSVSTYTNGHTEAD